MAVGTMSAALMQCASASAYAACVLLCVKGVIGRAHVVLACVLMAAFLVRVYALARMQATSSDAHQFSMSYPCAADKPQLVMRSVAESAHHCQATIAANHMRLPNV